MITRFSIGNFKAFAEVQQIPVKPLTLVFGANSAGKSSIIQGLLLGCHVSATGQFDVHRTDAGGKSVDLGGFRQFAHRHRLDVPVEWGLRTLGEPNGPVQETEKSKEYEAVIKFGLLNGTVQESTAVSTPRLLSLTVLADGQQILSMTRHSNDELVLASLNSGHRTFDGILSDIRTSEQVMEYDDDGELVSFEDVENIVLGGDVLTPELLQASIDHLIANLRFDDSKFIPNDLTTKWRGAVANLQNSLFPSARFPGIRVQDTDIYLPQIDEEGVDENQKRKIAFKLLCYRILDRLLPLLTQVSRSIDSELRNVRYLGPLRFYPPRHIGFNDDAAVAFAEGESAWEMIQRNPQLRSKVNRWLGSAWLNTGYEFFVNEYVSQDPRLPPITEVVLRDKRTDTVVSHRDIGVGMSQILPVLVTAYGCHTQTIAIEQPEIHLHPKLQAELGDIFIESAVRNKNRLLLETHSEHLILRIMKRMRQTFNGELPDGALEVTPQDVAVVFVQPTFDGSSSFASILELDEQGQLLDPWPGGFFEEGFHELFG